VRGADRNGKVTPKGRSSFPRLRPSTPGSREKTRSRNEANIDNQEKKQEHHGSSQKQRLFIEELS